MSVFTTRIVENIAVKKISNTAVNSAFLLAAGKNMAATKYVRETRISVSLGAQHMNNEVSVTKSYVLAARKVAIPSVPRQRAWTYDFDGHSFYVLDLGQEGTWVFDTPTQKWSRFETRGYNNRWNFANGYHWRHNDLVVGGDILTSVVYKMNNNSHFDNDYRYNDYKTTGVLSNTSREGTRIDSARLFVSTESPILETPLVTLRFTDNGGATWSKNYTQMVLKDTQSLDWKSLGMTKNQGRIFEISCIGGLVRFDSFMVRVDGKENG